MSKKEKKIKDDRTQAKYVHITLQGLKNDSKTYWLEKGKTFRSNTVACLVGLEENHEEGKGLHAHIVMQFSTKQKLSRKQCIEHFGIASLHIATKPNKEALLMALGYVSKTGNTAQYGKFTHRGLELSDNPEVYRFQYQVKTKDDAIKYFYKVIKENLKTNKNIIKEYAKREDPIGRYLVANPTLTNSLHKLAYTWYLDAKNAAKEQFRFYEWVSDPIKLQDAYQAYLKEFPRKFNENLPIKSSLVLEHDYDQHIAHELEMLDDIIAVLKEALKHGSKRPHKSLNLFLWSCAPSFGKTRLLKFLDQRMMAYRLPDDQWYVDYENGMYQVLVSDEAAAFLKSKDYSHLKHILEGERVEFNLKGREKIFKEDNPLIVLADNMSFSDLMKKHFPKRYDQAVMATRVLDLELKSRATLHFLLDRCFIEKRPEKITKKLH